MNTCNIVLNIDLGVPGICEGILIMYQCVSDTHIGYAVVFRFPHIRCDNCPVSPILL